ncbi:MAG: hypothetical protein OXH96_12690 [Spirochaetaceae bacterium]|nr:hypothetical protein [Spirochaetaceae bacterium]
MSDYSERDLKPRPYGRRSAIALLVAAAGLLVWALTAGDDPTLRTTAVAGVVALTIVGITIRFAHRTVREQRHADGETDADAARAGTAAASGGPPDSYQELLHQLDAASRSPSYLKSVVVPRLEQILAGKQPGPAAAEVDAELQRLAAAARDRNPWLTWLLGERRATAVALAAVARKLADLP